MAHPHHHHQLRQQYSWEDSTGEEQLDRDYGHHHYQQQHQPQQEYYSNQERGRGYKSNGYGYDQERMLDEPPQNPQHHNRPGNSPSRPLLDTQGALASQREHYRQNPHYNEHYSAEPQSPYRSDHPRALTPASQMSSHPDALLPGRGSSTRGSPSQSPVDGRQQWDRNNSNSGDPGMGNGHGQRGPHAPPPMSGYDDGRQHRHFEERQYPQEHQGYGQESRGYDGPHHGHHQQDRYGPHGQMGPGPHHHPQRPGMAPHYSSNSSSTGFGPDGMPIPPAHGTPYSSSNSSTTRVLNAGPLGEYSDNPYKRYSTTWDPIIAYSNDFNSLPENYVDDDDDVYGPGAQDRQGSGSRMSVAGSAVVGGIATAVKRASQTFTGNRSSGAVLLAGAGAGAGAGGDRPVVKEKSEWLAEETKRKKKLKWIVISVLIVIILAAAGAAAAVTILNKKDDGGTSSGSSSKSAAEDDGSGLLDRNSKEIKQLMNNPKLKKIFHGIDYTPMGAADYPNCLVNPPSQNNVTRDIAVMSLLTDKIRLYGNDCNQTELVVTAIQRLNVDMKVWIGVWLDANQTTNARQTAELWNILDNFDHKYFEGVAVGNEVLYREELTQYELISIMQEVRKNLTTRGIKLPVGTSDLGSNWDATMAGAVDVLMANVHPFFAGVKVEDAADWTMKFFEQNDVYYARQVDPMPRVMISEVGWPSGGGRKNASIAGVEELNIFLNDFVCEQNKAGTEYFWFSAFDEPWKVRFNIPGKEEWEDKWGLMDVNRNLKDGIIIPDCK